MHDGVGLSVCIVLCWYVCGCRERGEGMEVEGREAEGNRQNVFTNKKKS